MAADWFFRIMGDEFGPISGAELRHQVAEGRITPETEVRKGDGRWILAGQVRNLFERGGRTRPVGVEGAPPPPPTPPAPPPLPPLPPDATSVFIPRRSAAAQLQASGQYEVLQAVEADGFTVEVLAFPRLGGARDHQTAATVFFANQAGLRLKQVRITLHKSELVAEAGALHFLMGAIEVESRVGGVSGLGKAMVNKFLTRESAFLPRYRGTGQIYLEPSFSHFLIHALDGEELIADRGMFYCGQGSLDVSAALQRNVSSALFGGEGLFQTRVRGHGLCVFESPVPADEVLRVDLRDDVLQVDGNFALMRSGAIEFSVEKSTRSLLGTLTSGELLLQTFRGTGSVWLAPTQDIYQRMAAEGLGTLGAAGRSSGTST